MPRDSATRPAPPSTPQPHLPTPASALGNGRELPGFLVGSSLKDLGRKQADVAQREVKVPMETLRQGVWPERGRLRTSLPGHCDIVICNRNIHLVFIPVSDSASKALGCKC